MTSDKIGLEFIDLYRIFKQEIKVEHDRIDDRQTYDNMPVSIDERLETTVNALLKVIEANNKKITTDLSR
jgi:hypothetical protein